VRNRRTPSSPPLASSGRHPGGGRTFARLFLPVTALALAGCSGAADAGEKPSDDIAVTASDSACDVATTTLASGTHRFTVTNEGSKVTEFYVYAEGDRIVGEVENVAPGVARSLLVDLPAGKYQAACKPGMKGDGIRSALTVTGSSASAAADDEALQKAVTVYEVYVRDQVADLQRQTAQFAAAIAAEDVAKAQQLYPQARTPYERIEPVAESFGDLDPKIDARENDVEPGQTWTGFHVLEKTLWTGGALAAAGPVAEQLKADVGDLAARVQTLDLKPLDLANGALGLLDEIAKSKITGEEDRYSHTDLWDFEANLEGSEQAIRSLRPVIAERDAALASALDEQFEAAETALEQYRQGDGYRPYTDLTKDQTRALSDALNALAAQVSRVPAVIAQK
jgi:iron uptake system component EfeO